MCSNMFNHILLMPKPHNPALPPEILICCPVPQCLCPWGSCCNEKITQEGLGDSLCIEQKSEFKTEIHSKGKNLFFVMVSGQGLPHAFQTQGFSFRGACWGASDLSLGTEGNTRLQLLSWKSKDKILGKMAGWPTEVLLLRRWTCLEKHHEKTEIS